MEGRVIKKRKTYERKRWTQEELDIFKLYWSNPEKTYKDVAVVTGRTYEAICSKASQLGLKKAKYTNMKVEEGFKICSSCKQSRPNALFKGKMAVCKICTRINNAVEIIEDVTRVCICCKQEKKLEEFVTAYGKKTNQCKACKNEKYKQYILTRTELKGY